MAKLFEEMKIKNIRLANRFVRFATREGLAEKDGSVAPALIDRMVAHAGGCGVRF